MKARLIALIFINKSLTYFVFIKKFRKFSFLIYFYIFLLRQIKDQYLHWCWLQLEPLCRLQAGALEVNHNEEGNDEVMKRMIMKRMMMKRMMMKKIIMKRMMKIIMKRMMRNMMMKTFKWITMMMNTNNCVR